MTLTVCILEYTSPGLTTLKVRIELSPCSLMHQATKTHMADEVQLDIFYTSQGEKSVSWPSRFTSGTHSKGGWMGPGASQSGQCGALLGTEPQPTAYKLY
jgi:hypothetical protein